jgi:dTDP-4-dehydrorhamnose 3,5-epimerase
MDLKDRLLNGVLLFTPRVFKDKRGTFCETYRRKNALTLPDFVQENLSVSEKNVVRGLHFQYPSWQGKLIQVMSGEILDIFVDLRYGSIGFGRWKTIRIRDKEFTSIYVPPGFAHGFLTLANDTRVLYKCTEYYDPKGQYTLKWDDKDLNIKWPSVCPRGPILSEKDQKGMTLKEVENMLRKEYKRQEENK